MMKSVSKPNMSALPCRLSWLLVEVKKDLKADYYTIHSVEVIGDCNNAYVERKVEFTHQGQILTGIIRLASDDLKAIEIERDRLILNQKKFSNSEIHLNAELWCLVRLTTDDIEVRLAIVNCKQLISIDSPDIHRKQFLIQKGLTQVPVSLLHIIPSEHKLFEEMKLINNYFIQICMSDEQDTQVESQGLEEAFLLVQYFEDASNLVYSILRYKETVWKDKNLFPNVVAYKSDGRTMYQCVILRKSYDKNELITLLSQIKETCVSIDYPLLHSKLNDPLSAFKDIGKYLYKS